ncbi:MAG: hypothetical protein V1724_08275 [Chloroflexota bacterium]
MERPTLEAIATRHGIPSGTLRNRAHREGWAEERSIFVTNLLQKTHEKTLEQLADKASQLDLQAFSVARAALSLAGKAFIEGAQAGNLSPGDQERLLRLCDLAHRMGRRALGIGDTSE